MTVQSKTGKVGWRFWLAWWLASTAAWAIGLVLYRASSASALLATLLLLVALCGGTALFQWLVLRAHLPHTRGWVLATTVGYLLPALVPNLTLAPFAWVLAGVFQWLVIRGKVFQAGWWIPANVAGWLAMSLVVGITTFFFGSELISLYDADGAVVIPDATRFNFALDMGVLVGAALASAITGTVLTRQLRQTVQAKSAG